MTTLHGFTRIYKRKIRELRTEAHFFRHVETGAELLSLINDDENKVFGITFRTPPSDSTGVAHILEHAVLGGSRKYPVREPFVELLKSSLQTFMNAFTYPDKTVYPLASQNQQDFYNLIDVYLDAVLYPRLSLFTFQQEGWRVELQKPDEPLVYKGVVYGEMKGVYSSPESVLMEYSQQSLFPDNTYGHDSGGRPDRIVTLTYAQFLAFHRHFYHPSNARICFYGDDDPETRLALVQAFLRDFKFLEVDSGIPLHKPFSHPRRLTRSFASGQDRGQGLKGMLTVNWLLADPPAPEAKLALQMLDYILLGMPGSPLRKALIESGLGEDLAGDGLGGELRQMTFSTGLKGIDPDRAERIEGLILATLTALVRHGIDRRDIEAALNTLEFHLRENNTGRYPRGLALMLRAMTTWLYNDDPLALVSFAAPLAKLKREAARDKNFFESLIKRHLLDNPHRVTLILKPDPELARAQEQKEQTALADLRAALSDPELNDLIKATRELKEAQSRPDPPQALAAVPALHLTDLSPDNKTIPLAEQEHKEVPMLFHDLFTNGILYLDLGFNLHALPQKHLPYVRLFGRALLEMGTKQEDYVTLTQRISRKTGGLHSSSLNAAVKDAPEGAVWLFLQGKAVPAQVQAMLDIIRDILLSPRFDQRERFRQIVLEAKARYETQLLPAGHQIIHQRLKAHFSEAGWTVEQMRGIQYLFFLRNLAVQVEEDWPGVLKTLREIREILVNRRALLLNITVDQKDWKTALPRIKAFLDLLPASALQTQIWQKPNLPAHEGFTLPTQVHYVGKGFNLYETGYTFQGSALVVCRYLDNAWLWERVRAQGGAYGAFCSLDRFSGAFTLVSYRDPNLRVTLETFDRTARFLKETKLDADELSRHIIGTIGDLDQYQLPDAKGYTSMVRYLTGDRDEERRQMRREILETKINDFWSMGEVLTGFAENGLIKVLSSDERLQKAAHELPDQLALTKLL